MITPSFQAAVPYLLQSVLGLIAVLALVKDWKDWKDYLRDVVNSEPKGVSVRHRIETRSLTLG